MAALIRLGSAYNRQLTAHPVITKTCTACTIAAAGDVVCQRATAETASPPLDGKRTARMVVFNAGVTPLVHLWYGALVKRFPSSVAHSALKRMVADQTLWAPVGLAAFLGANSLMETGGSGPAAKAAIAKSFLPVLQVRIAWSGPPLQCTSLPAIGCQWPPE